MYMVRMAGHGLKKYVCTDKSAYGGLFSHVLYVLSYINECILIALKVGNSKLHTDPEMLLVFQTHCSIALHTVASI